MTAGPTLVQWGGGWGGTCVTLARPATVHVPLCVRGYFLSGLGLTENRGLLFREKLYCHQTLTRRGEGPGRGVGFLCVFFSYFFFLKPVPLWPSISRGLVVTASSTEQTSTPPFGHVRRKRGERGWGWGVGVVLRAEGFKHAECIYEGGLWGLNPVNGVTGLIEG